MKRIIAFVPIAVIASGAVAFATLVKTRPAPAKAPVDHRGTLVEVLEVKQSAPRVRLPAKGIVVPAQNLALHVEVPGRVRWRHANLVPGGRFKKGDVLLRIDPRDYEIALEQQASAVDKAKLELEMELGRRAVAQREWDLLERSTAKLLKPVNADEMLALRGPQLRTARASLHAAERSRDGARLSLDRTVVRAPWNLMVRESQVDVGQLVLPQQPLGVMVGTDAYWVQVSVPIDWLVWLADDAGQIEPTPARVFTQAGGHTIERTGRVVRLLGDVDPVGRMARLLVEIDDPLVLAPRRVGTNPPPPRLPLLVGTYVNVDLEANDLGPVVELPDRAVREGNRVHLVGPDDRLAVREIKVAFRTPRAAYVSAGLRPGDRVVLSRLAAPVPGMLLRTNGGAATPTTAAAPRAAEHRTAATIVPPSRGAEVRP